MVAVVVVEAWEQAVEPGVGEQQQQQEFGIWEQAAGLVFGEVEQEQ